MLETRDNMLHIIDTLWLGGAQRVIKKLFEENASNRKIHLLVLRRTAEMITVNHPNVTCISSSRRWNFYESSAAVYKYLKSHDIGTLHCHLPKSQTIGVLLKRLVSKEIRLIFQEQGDIMDKVPFNLPAYLSGRRHIEMVVCCSAAVQRALIDRTGIEAGKVTVIHNFPSVTPAESSGNAAPSLLWNIGFAGRIVRHKGWREFIEALFLVKQELPADFNIAIHIAGVGPDLAELKHMVSERGLSSNTTFYGFVQDMSVFYRKLDVLCVPSHLEPMGMVHIEAMGFGVAVVGSDVPGMNDILLHEHNSLLFQPKHPEGIKKAILRLIRDAACLRSLSEQGLETAGQYSYRHFEQQMNAVYQELNT